MTGARGATGATSNTSTTRTTGTTGAAGTTGANGPTGLASPTGVLAGIQVNLVDEGIVAVADDAPVIFTAIVNDASPNISYSATIGVFATMAPVNYYVHWWAATDGAEDRTSVSLGINIDAVSARSASSPIITDQISGDAYLTIGMVPATVLLVNCTGLTVTIANSLVRASRVIAEQTNKC